MGEDGLGKADFWKKSWAGGLNVISSNCGN